MVGGWVWDLANVPNVRRGPSILFWWPLVTVTRLLTRVSGVIISGKGRQKKQNKNPMYVRTLFDARAIP
jgi:hypothetical protein